MPRKRKQKPEEPVTVTELLETGLVKPASEIDSPDLPQPDQDFVPSAPRRSDEPTPLSEVLGQSPIAKILASQEPASSTEEVAAEPRSHVQRLTGLRPAPKGFLGIEGHYHAGIRLTRSLDKNVVGVQFADDWRPSRDGLNPENELLRGRGFAYRPERAQWERYDREQPGENYQDAKEFVAGLVKARLAERENDVGRS